MRELTPEAIATRIEDHRKHEVTIHAVGPDGKSLPNVTLQVELARHAFRFGCNLFLWQAEPTHWQLAYRARFRELLNFATLGFYWWAYESEQGKPRHAYVDNVLEWCDDARIVCKGHPLVWNWAAPKWLPNDTAAIRRLSDERVRDCVARFAGRISIWDAVNEATDPFRRGMHGENFDNLLSEAWKEYGRIEFTKHCFHVARESNPDATLLINDYRHDSAYEELIESLTDRDGRPLYDAIGIQTHQHGGAIPTDTLWNLCERFARFHVPLHFTETTLLSGSKTSEGWKTTPQGEERQAEEVVAFYTTLFSHPSVHAITWWDFSDRHAWQGAPAGFLREDMSPKPAYDRLKALIQGEWWTKAEVRTDGEGLAKLRGFYGDYNVKIRGDNGASATSAFSIERGMTEPITIQG